MIDIVCRKCGRIESPLDIPFQEHHLIPVYCFKGSTRKERKNQADKEGRKRLCKPCHDRLHKEIEAMIFRDWVIDKESCKEAIKEYANKWIGKKK